MFENVSCYNTLTVALPLIIAPQLQQQWHQDSKQIWPNLPLMRLVPHSYVFMGAASWQPSRPTLCRSSWEDHHKTERSSRLVVRKWRDEKAVRRWYVQQAGGLFDRKAAVSSVQWVDRKTSRQAGY